MSNKFSSRSVVIDPRRSGFKWSMAVGLTLLVIAALFVATTRATSTVVGDGIALSRAEATLGANDVALKALSQAVLLAEDNALGVADVNTLTLAIREANLTLDDLADRADELVEATGSAEIETLSAAAVGSGKKVLQRIQEAQIDAAGVELSEMAIVSFEQLRDEVSLLRDAQETAMTSSGAFASRLGDIVTFLGLVLLPVGAIMVYRFAARRQLHKAEIQLDARLDAEREVMRAKDEFIGNISHELRTPLTSIFGFSEVLLESGAVDPATTLDLVGLINYESGELARMVEDLLVSARLEANALAYKNEHVNIESELASVLSTMRYQGSEDIDVLLTDIQCWGDPVRVRQILRNLMSNAQRYGGSTIRVTSARKADMLELSVADNGEGVPDDMVPRLFTRFVHGGQEALMAGSVGLGLSVVGSLTEAMGGSAHYEYRDGWARFSVHLPVDPSAVPVPQVDPLEEESAAQADYLRTLLHTGDDRGITARAGHDG